MKPIISLFFLTALTFPAAATVTSKSISFAISVRSISAAETKEATGTATIYCLEKETISFLKDKIDDYSTWTTHQQGNTWVIVAATNDVRSKIYLQPSMGCTLHEESPTPSAPVKK